MKRLAIASIIALAALGAQAQTTLTLEQCRTQALEHNKSLMSAREKVNKQTHDMKAVRTNFYPNISGFAADFYSTGSLSLSPFISSSINSVTNPMAQSLGGFMQKMAASDIMQLIGSTPEGAQLLQNINGIAGLLQSNGLNVNFPKDQFKVKLGNIFTAGVSLTQPIYMGGKIATGYKMSKLGVKMAETNVRLTEAEVLLNTDQAYVLCIQAKELGEVAKSYKALLLELQKNVDAAVRQGLKTRNDALKVQVKLNEAELNIAKTNNAYRLAQMNLAQVIGSPLDEPIEISTEGIYMPIDENITNSNGIETRPEYTLLSNKTEMARLNVNLVRSDFLPKIVFMAGYGYVHGGKFMDQRLLNNGSANVGVGLQIPIFHFLEGTHKVRSAKASHKLAEYEQQELNEKMQLERMQAYNTLTESATEISITEKSVEQAAENMRTSKQQYEVGTEPLSDYLEAQAMWQQASAQAVSARCQYLLAYSKYLKASGANR